MIPSMKGSKSNVSEPHRPTGCVDRQTSLWRGTLGNIFSKQKLFLLPMIVDFEIYTVILSA